MSFERIEPEIGPTAIAVVSNCDQVASLYPEADTPLADIDPILPTLSLFQTLTTGKYMRDKAAVLRVLALAEHGVWTYGELDALLWWIPAPFKRYIVDQMRGTLILYDDVNRSYSLNPQARVICTVLTSLGGKKDGAKTFVAHLLKLQELADIGANGSHRRWDPLRTAVTWLQSRQLDLENALRQGLVESALAKAQEIDAVLDQIREFLAAQDAVLQGTSGEVPSEALNFLRDGHRTAAEVLNLVHFVYRTLAQASNEFLSGRRNFTAQDVRVYAAQASREEIICSLRGTFTSLPWSCPESANTVLAGAVSHFSIERHLAPPLPEVSGPKVFSAASTGEDSVQELACRISADIEEFGKVQIRAFAVGSDWPDSSSTSRLLPEAHALLIDREIAGKNPAPVLISDSSMEEVERGGVAAITNARFERSDKHSQPRLAIDGNSLVGAMERSDRV